MAELDYAVQSKKIEKELKKAKEFVLATCAEGRVTARTVCPLNDVLTVLISTGGKSLKIDQIKANPHIALILGGINIEAVAEIYGHPGTHPTFAKEYSRKYPHLGKIYKNDPDDVLVIALPTMISIYDFYQGSAQKIMIDIGAQRAYREQL